MANLVMNLRLAEFGLVQRSAEVRDRFGLGQIENQYPEKTLRFFLLGGVYRTLHHPHNRLVVGSSPTGPTIFKERRGALRAAPATSSRLSPPTTFQSNQGLLCDFLQFTRQSQQENPLTTAHSFFLCLGSYSLLTCQAELISIPLQSLPLYLRPPSSLAFSATLLA